MRQVRRVVLAAIACAAFANSAAAVVTVDWTPVGNPGNANDSTNFGAVSYPYLISRHEVTNGQYVEFLNAKAANDPHALYNTSMSTDAQGGIVRSGSAGSFTYSVKSGQANKPVVFVSYFDGLRFANWMSNGQGSGDTETGGYTIGNNESNPALIPRNTAGGATIFLTAEDEWYKAAYHQPTAAGGDADNYWLYATRTNTEPNSDQPPGDPTILNNAANFFRDDATANGFNDGYAVTGSTTQEEDVNYLTNVGAYTGSPSFYGTFDQSGNVFEWSEIHGSSIGLRGGGWFNSSGFMQSNLRISPIATTEGRDIGFRLSSVPEPGSAIVLLTLATALVAQRNRRAAHRLS